VAFGVILAFLNRDGTGEAVNKLIVRRWLLALSLMAVPALASAVGMGRLSVLSSLGQTLNAEVELVSVRKEELGTLTARLASPDAYKQANLQYGAAAAGLRFSIQKRPSGELYIKITSARSVDEPFVNLLIELSWASGRLVREYTALIDPPDYAPPQSVVAAPAPAPETRPVPITQAPVAVATPAPAKPAAASEYGPIKRGETLSKIAASVKPDGVSLDQMLIAILRGNPDAFANNNINRMKAGKMLRIPDKAELTAVTPQEAVKEVRLQATDWNRYRQKVADTAGLVSERKSAASKREKISVKDKTTEPKPVLRLSTGEPPGGAAGKGRSKADRVQVLEEELIARERALNDANQRIKELEKAVKESAK
jgi:pilus assembly protein FimV